jgi:hypothetical protein
MLTTGQALAIASRKPLPPWSTRDLMAEWGLNRLSLRSFVDGIDRQNLTIWINIADYIDFSFVTDIASLNRAVIAAPSPMRKSMVVLYEEMATVGVSLLVSGTTWKTVGLSGKTEAMAHIKAFQIKDYSTALGAFGGAAGIVGTAIFAVGLIPSPWSPFLLVGGGAIAGAGAGAFTAQMIIELQKDTPPSKPTSELDLDPTQDQLDFPDDNIGSPPRDIMDAIAAGVGVDKFILGDTNDLPDNPPGIGGPEDYVDPSAIDGFA